MLENINQKNIKSNIYFYQKLLFQYIILFFKYYFIKSNQLNKLLIFVIYNKCSIKKKKKTKFVFFIINKDID